MTRTRIIIALVCVAIYCGLTIDSGLASKNRGVSAIQARTAALQGI